MGSGVIEDYKSRDARAVNLRYAVGLSARALRCRQRFTMQPNESDDRSDDCPNERGAEKVA